MIVGAHAIIYTKDAEVDRAFLRDVIGLSSVDVGGGSEMSAKKVKCNKIHEEQWGRVTEVALPGGGKVGVYQPLHARPTTSA